jgi:hypothetical protein
MGRYRKSICLSRDTAGMEARFELTTFGLYARRHRSYQPPRGTLYLP